MALQPKGTCPEQVMANKTLGPAPTTYSYQKYIVLKSEPQDELQESEGPEFPFAKALAIQNSDGQLFDDSASAKNGHQNSHCNIQSQTERLLLDGEDISVPMLTDQLEDICEEEELNVQRPLITYERPYKFILSSNNTKFSSKSTKKFPFMCKICEKTFKTTFALRQHEIEHSSKGRYQCKVCKKGFPSAFFSACHQEIYHSKTKEEGWEARRSGYKKNVLLNQIIKGKLFDPQTNLQCKVCGKNIDDSVKVAEHMRHHTGLRPYKCHVCQKRFTCIEKLMIHRHIHSMERLFKCFICSKKFSRLNLLKRHSHTHVEGSQNCEILLKALSGSNSSTKKERKSNIVNVCGKTMYQCDICQKVLSQSSALKMHRKTHTGERPHVCDVCNKAFMRVDNLVIHKRTHTGERPFTCEVCGKSFPQVSSLIKHQTVHTGAKPYACEICEKRFSQSSNLSAHKKTHLGLKPHKCDQCGKGFARPFGLKIHMRSHTGEKPFECEVCHKKFAQMYFVVRHMRIHTGDKPYACEVCGKKFNQSSVLASHMRTHTGENPYKCKECGKGFKQSSGLRSHKKKHASNPTDVYKCKICQHTFQTESALASHEKLCTMDGIMHDTEFQISEATILEQELIAPTILHLSEDVLETQTLNPVHPTQSFQVQNHSVASREPEHLRPAGSANISVGSDQMTSYGTGGTVTIRVTKSTNVGKI